jgi:hypothetical protein
VADSTMVAGPGSTNTWASRENADANLRS